MKRAAEAACAEREELRGRLADASRALSQVRAESACRSSKNRTLLGKLASAQVPLSIPSMPSQIPANLSLQRCLFLFTLLGSSHHFADGMSSVASAFAQTNSCMVMLTFFMACATGAGSEVRAGGGGQPPAHC